MGVRALGVVAVSLLCCAVVVGQWWLAGAGSPPQGGGETRRGVSGTVTCACHRGVTRPSRRVVVIPGLPFTGVALDWLLRDALAGLVLHPALEVCVVTRPGYLRYGGFVELAELGAVIAADLARASRLESDGGVTLCMGWSYGGLVVGASAATLGCQGIVALDPVVPAPGQDELIGEASRGAFLFGVLELAGWTGLAPLAAAAGWVPPEAGCVGPWRVCGATGSPVFARAARDELVELVDLLSDSDARTRLAASMSRADVPVVLALSDEIGAGELADMRAIYGDALRRELRSSAACLGPAGRLDRLDRLDHMHPARGWDDPDAAAAVRCAIHIGLDHATLP